MHKGLLCKASSVFETALTTLPADNTSHEGIIHDVDSKWYLIPKEDPATFQRFNVWLYAGKITLEGETVEDLTWSNLISLYLFATKRRIPRLQNKCIDATLERQQAGLPLPADKNVNRLWKRDVSAMPLRNLFLQLFARKCNLESAIGQNPGYDTRFLQGLIVTMYQMRQLGVDEVDFWKIRESYYVNDEENPVVLTDDE